MMTPERHVQIGQIFVAALELEPEERSAFLKRACGNDEALRREVEALLASHSQESDFIARPAVAMVAEALAKASGPAPAGHERGPIKISHYQVLEKIGAGGMGEVYRARDRKLERDVAIKFLPEAFTHDVDRVARFHREARVLASLNHPNIAVIYGLEESGGRDFLVMELVRGETLAERIHRGAMPVMELLAVAAQIASSLEAAHENGVIHRDIKPANLMLTRQGQVKVLDFGLAKMNIAADRSLLNTTEAALTETGVVMGTVQYMSPEQVLGRDVDQRTDIFSLGAVLYQMATGRLPFAGRSAGETMDLILHAEPEPIAPLDEGELARIVRKCLEKDRQRRYMSARDLLVDLRNLQQEGAAGVASTRGDARRQSPALRRTAKGRLLLATTMVVIVGSVYFIWLRSTRSVPSFGPRDWVLVTDVENQTGDPVFDKSLLTAFVIGLEESRYTNVLPRTRVSESRKRMKKTGSEPIDETLGRDIALREGVRALIIPTISGVGGTYQLAARIQNPSTPRDVRTEQVRANGKDKVLGAVDTLIAEIRLDLGESLSALAQTSKPLAQVTTASMEALKEYSNGNEKARATDFAEAKIYLENAIRIDPNFTAAKAQLGIIDFESFNREEGKQLLSEAIQHVDTLTDREKYGIQAFYAVAVEKDLPKAIQLYKLLLGLHPDEWNVYNNLGWYNYQLGRGEDAVSAYKEALRLDPNAMISYNGFVMVNLYLLGDLDSALDLCGKQISYDDRLWFAHENMGWALLGKGDLAAARQAFEKALEINDKAAEVRLRLANTYLLQGRYRDAADMYLMVLSLNSNEYYAYYDAGLACQLSGDSQCERENFAKFVQEVNRRIRSNSGDAQYRLDLAKAFVRTGRGREGQALGNRAIQMAPGMHFEIAQLLSVQGKTDDAITRLELAVQNGFRNFVLLKVDPDLQPLQNAPRFRELLKAHLRG